MNLKSMFAAIFPGLLILASIPGTTWAGSVQVPFAFQDGTPAVAAEVNQNFTEMQTAVNDNDSQIKALQTQVSALQAQVDTLSTQLFDITHHTVGGVASGITGAGLVLQNNGGDDLSIPADGPFTFASAIAENASYVVAVKTNPAGQLCSVTNGSGTMGTADVTDVSVSCANLTLTDEIQFWRNAPDGTGLSGYPIEYATVTYNRPAIGNDPAGFYVQAGMSGPAIFVAIDPATLSPVPAVGDTISFTPTAKYTSHGAPHISAITAYVTFGGVGDVSQLIQDVSNYPDLVDYLDSYESELIYVWPIQITGFFGPSGTGFSAATVDTNGVTGNSLLKLRLPETIRSSLDLDQGCTVQLYGTPLWRNNTEADLSAWNETEILVSSCNAPVVSTAYATAADGVRVVFSRQISPASIVDPATQFTLDNGLVVTSAVISGNAVDLTTSLQTNGVNYTVVVDPSVTDTLGTGVNLEFNNNQAVFSGYNPNPPDHLVINEVDYDNAGTDTNEFVEIYNPTTQAIDLAGMQLVFVNGLDGSTYWSGDLSAEGLLLPGEYLVAGSTTLLASVPPATRKITLPNASDNLQNGAPDGVALISSGGTIIDALSYEGETISQTWGSLVEGVATSAMDNNSVYGASLARCPNALDDDNAQTDWSFTSSGSPGVANTCQ